MRMHQLSFQDVSFRWPQGRDILRDLTTTIPLEGTIALCGPNGCGKSTLLSLIAGERSPDSGRIALHPDTETRLIGQRLDEREKSPGQAQRARLDPLFRDDDFLLLLDEPTNHLDRASLEELERRLRRRVAPTLLVSHDRDLLDRIATRTLWLEDGDLAVSDGGFDAAWKARSARMESALSRRTAQDMILGQTRMALQAAQESKQASNRHRTAGRRMKDAHDRDATSMAADFRFRTAQSRLGRDAGRLERKLRRLESESVVEIKRDTLRDLEFPWDRSRASRRLGLESGAFACPDGSRIRHDGICLDGRSRLRLEGPNGAGKSTILSALAAPGTDGIAHLPQETSTAEDLELLESVRAAPSAERGRILALAAALGASGEALLASKAPSPGEARKLRLAGMLAHPNWLLLLDEPTNHLDAASIQKLQEALTRWPGGIVVATHDDRLAAAVAERSWTLRNGRLFQGEDGIRPQGAIAD